MDSMQELFFSKLGIVGHSGDFFTVAQGEDWTIPVSVFAQNKFYYIKEGRCSFCINDENYDGVAGRVFLIPAGIPHSYCNDKTGVFSAYQVFFDIYPNNIGIFNLMDLPFFVEAKDDNHMKFFFNEYVEYIDRERVADILHIKSCLIEIIKKYMILAECDGLLVKNSKNKVFNRIIDYIDENVDKNMSNEELAEKFHFHPNHLIRVFKKETGQTLAKYIKLRKMETAKQLIEETAFNLNEIMIKVGIDDAAHFSKTFKSVYGVSPKIYRQEIRNLLRMQSDGVFHRTEMSVDCINAENK